MNIPPHDPLELNRKSTWQALGGSKGEKKAYGDTALQSAENFYAKFPNTRAPIHVRQVWSYDYLDKDTGKLVPMIKTIYGQGIRNLGVVTKANYKERLTIPKVSA